MSRDVTTIPLTDGSSSRLFAMTSAYIHEPSPFCRRSSSGRKRPGVESRRPAHSSMDAVAIVGVDRVEDALALGPRAARRTRTPARWSGSCTCSTPSASITEITSEMFATSPLSRSSDARICVLGLDALGDVAGVRDDTEHGGIVAVVGRHHLDPTELAVGPAEPVPDRLRRTRVSRAAVRTARPTRDDPPRSSAEVDGNARDPTRSRCRGTATRSGCGT